MQCFIFSFSFTLVVDLVRVMNTSSSRRFMNTITDFECTIRSFNTILRNKINVIWNVYI